MGGTSCPLGPLLETSGFARCRQQEKQAIPGHGSPRLHGSEHATWRAHTTSPREKTRRTSAARRQGRARLSEEGWRQGSRRRPHGIQQRPAGSKAFASGERVELRFLRSARSSRVPPSQLPNPRAASCPHLQGGVRTAPTPSSCGED